ncbi:Eukaryotic protein of unknown function (DUF829) [Geosmithia morbida]|uniref:Uncharacterized protein n=1 Tax=Geosmithia morbida TaxID=1094350 RepID=A0A9P4Z195_9HYPO|nr:Eukaryotic protein of unknown function (DUF829) [Geosmithia morbida]KAF4124784.1 Eukaryotic protein of unknown function (DUF829) [Geosmithia morbida]
MTGTLVATQVARLNSVADRVGLPPSPLVRSSAAGGALLLAFFAVLRLRQSLGGSRTSSSSSSSKPRQPQVPGFAPVTDQIFVRGAGPATESPDGEGAEDSQPDVLVLYGWGDGIPKHVAKYADGYAALFPRARQILVLSPISKAMFSEHDARALTMIPVVRALFPDGPRAESAPRSVAVHIMSNTGAINYASTLRAYTDMYGQPMPHDLLVLDSTPGSPRMTWFNLLRWSRAMALGLSAVVPLPFVVIQSISGVFLFVSGTVANIRGTQSSGSWASEATRDPELVTPSTRKLYLYSKEDDLISWTDIEENIAENKAAGWQTDACVFEGTGHVGHMRKHTRQYWHAIRQSWERKVASTGA